VAVAVEVEAAVRGGAAAHLDKGAQRERVVCLRRVTGADLGAVGSAMDVERGRLLPDLPGVEEDSDDDCGYASQDELEAPGDVTIQRLIEEVPESVISWLSKYGVQKLGELQVASKVALEFHLNEDIFLTMGQEYHEVPDFAAPGPGKDWKRMWRRVLSSRSSKKTPRIVSTAKKVLTQPGAKRKRILHGWESSHTLEASVVTLKNVCNLGERGCCRPFCVARGPARRTSTSSSSRWCAR